MKKVLFAASECVPFIKTGGLADVVGSLPKYFNKDEFDVRVMIPKYTAIPEEYKNQMQYLTHFYLELAWRKQYVGVFQMEYDGVIFYFLDNEFYFSGDKPYGEIYQDIEKFAFFDKAVLSTLPLIGYHSLSRLADGTDPGISEGFFPAGRVLPWYQDDYDNP